jgi:ABC-type amino acid transport system permease subunit
MLQNRSKVNSQKVMYMSFSTYTMSAISYVLMYLCFSSILGHLQSEFAHIDVI